MDEKRQRTGFEPVLLYDGECGLCTRSVLWTLAHERDTRVRFASLQSQVGMSLLFEHGMTSAAGGRPKVDSIVFVDAEGAHVRSEALMRLAAHLRAPWRWFRVGRLCPRVLRDAVYDMVARHRRRWLNTNQVCVVGDEATRSRFLD